MANRTEQINLRVTENRKERWSEFAEESRAVEGTSDLIRKAVTAFVESGGDPTAVATSMEGSQADVPENLSERLATIEDELSDVSSTVDRIDESTGFIERKVVESESDDEPTLSDALMRRLPPAKPTSDRWNELRERHSSTPVGEPIVWEGSVDGFYDTLEGDYPQVDRDLIMQSLESLQRNPNSDVNLETAIVDEEKRYWVERDPTDQPYADARTLKQEAKHRTEERKFQGRQEDRE